MGADPEPVAVVCHDAGGAEIVSSHLVASDVRTVFVLEGPAADIFHRKLGPVVSIALDDAIAAAAWLLCGTSWESDLELRAIRAARQAGIPSVAALDHWVNYDERFQREGRTILPDEIWVGDEHALALARATWPHLPTHLRPNPYLAEQAAEIEGLLPILRDPDGLRVLYICEPISRHALHRHGDRRYFGYVEDEAFRYFLSRLDVFEAPVAEVRVRPHPSDPPGTWEWATSEHPRVTLGGGASLCREIAEADVVVGCESMALVVALTAGKRVLSSIPPGGPDCGLPFPEIHQLRSL